MTTGSPGPKPRRALRAAGLLAALVLAGALAAAPAPARTLETILQDDAVFLHGGEAEIADSLGRLREIGVDRLRLTAGWSVIAPLPDSPFMPSFDAADPATYPAGNWANLDRAVRLATAAGIRPMIDIAFWAPRWATAEPADVTGRLRRDVDPRAFADFAHAVALRYSGHFRPAAGPTPEPAPSPDASFLDQLLGHHPPPPPEPAPAGPPEPLPAVDVFTIWNEPNHPGFLSPQWVQEDGRWVAHSADVYRAMVQAAYPAIKVAAPASRVLVGATSSFGSSRPGEAGVPPLAFLRRLACVDERLQPIETGGCAGYRPLPGDGWSHHPYSLRTTPDVRPRDPDNVPVASLDRLAFVLRALAQSGRIARADAGIYLTEYGYETNPPDPQARFGAADQAGLLAWAESLASAVPAVRSWPQFLLRDRPGDPAGPLMRPFGDWQSGLLYADGSPKPAYAEFRAPAAAECVATTGGLRTRIWARLRQPPAGVAGRVDIGTVRGWRSVAPRVARAAGAPDPGSLEAWLPGAPAAHLRLTWATSSGAVAVADLATRPCPRAAAARGHRSLRSRSPRNADGRHRRARRRS